MAQMKGYMLVYCLAILGPTTFSQTWQIEVVENAKSFSHMSDQSLRLDKQGYARVAYGADNFHYAFFDGVTWYYEAADFSCGLGASASLVSNKAGFTFH